MPNVNFSNFDVYAISKELNELLEGSSIVNVYELEDLLILKLNLKRNGRKNLIIKSDSRINLTEYDYPVPKYPSQFVMSLRKFLKNRTILGVSQFNFDRIIIVELSNINGEPWKLIIELFNKGNYLLLDENNILKVAKKYRKFRDRDILAGREFLFPPSRGKDFLTINQEDFKEIIKGSEAELVRILARNINISGLYGEELCYRAKINKKKSGNKLTEEELDHLFKIFRNLRNQVLFDEFQPLIILDDSNEEKFVIPFELEMYKDSNMKKCNTFNEAVDEFFSKIDSKVIKEPKDLRINQKIKTHKKILKNQLEYLEELKEDKKKYYEYGDYIYANFKTIENMINVILSAREKGYSWEDINNKLKTAKLENLPDTQLFGKILPASKQLIILINESEVYIDLNKSVGENANSIYDKGKKAEKKIKGTIPAIEKTKKKIKELKEQKESIETEINVLIKKPKKKWYEKFHWFITSEGFLVIGGKDASSNEVIFKKYMETNDLVFHTNFPGSPLMIIKNTENLQISEVSLEETAIFVASFSRAWKESWNIVDVFFVNSSQVSKTPPSGEFLPKGSFIITGKKNFMRNIKTELAIALELEELEGSIDNQTKLFYPRILCGPIISIKSQVSSNILIIKPSKTGISKGKLAKEIKEYYIKNINKEFKKWVKLLPLDEILLKLPSGTSVMELEKV
ncbi:MAG: ribosome rescue protein RqcH [Promethearchaeota archaeon]